MKSHKLFSLLFACIFALTLFSCDDDSEGGANPDYTTNIVGVYTDPLGTDAVEITKTGDNEITLSNSVGTPLSADITVTVSNETTAEFAGVSTTTYTTSSTNVVISKTDLTGTTLTVTGSDSFIGTKN